MLGQTTLLSGQIAYSRGSTPLSRSVYCSSVVCCRVVYNLVRLCKGSHVEGILPKGPYPPCLRMADGALLVGFPRCVFLRWVPEHPLLVLHRVAVWTQAIRVWPFYSWRWVTRTSQRSAQGHSHHTGMGWTVSVRKQITHLSQSLKKNVQCC